MAPVLKTGDVRASVGSNPTFPAKDEKAPKFFEMKDAEPFCL